jgi:hypothetical protein
VPLSPKASKVGGDHGEALGESRRDPMPHEVRLGDAVQQEDRWTLAAPASVNRRPRRGDIELIEAIEHDVRSLPPVVALARPVVTP